LGHFRKTLPSADQNFWGGFEKGGGRNKKNSRRKKLHQTFVPYLQTKGKKKRGGKKGDQKQKGGKILGTFVEMKEKRISPGANEIPQGPSKGDRAGEGRPAPAIGNNPGRLETFPNLVLLD